MLKPEISSSLKTAIEFLQQANINNPQLCEAQKNAIQTIRLAIETGQGLETLYFQLQQATQIAAYPQLLYLLGAQVARKDNNMLHELQCWHQIHRLNSADLIASKFSEFAPNRGLSAELANQLGFTSPKQWQQTQTAWQSKRAQFIRDSYSDIRAQHGARALFKIDRALAGYLGEASVFPSALTQKPKFMYIPGLPDTGFHHAYDHPCAKPLTELVNDLRNEFLRYQADFNAAENTAQFEPYMELSAGAAMSDFVGGSNPQARWDAVFFYRHGQRIAKNHVLCPKTSAALDALPLVQIKDQTPEICYSVMQPGTTIKAHHGVSNARLVLHIPLIVPEGAHLELPSVGKHFWKEGQAMLFDDTFLHLAQNPAPTQRVILLLDVWNHHLKDFEIEAFKALVEAISSISQVGAVRE